MVFTFAVLHGNLASDRKPYPVALKRKSYYNLTIVSAKQSVNVNHRNEENKLRTKMAHILRPFRQARNFAHSRAFPASSQNICNPI